MQNRNFISVVWIILIVVLSSSLAFSQTEDVFFEIEELETTIQNIQNLVEIEKDEGDKSPQTYIIKTSDKLLFCDKNYNPLSSVDIIPNETQILLSKKSHYVLTREYLNNQESQLKVRFTLYGYKGNKYWSREEIMMYDVSDQRSQVISDLNGNLFEMDASTAIMKITDIHGMITEIRLFDEAPLLKHRFQSIDISKNGKCLAVCVNKQVVIAGGTIRKTPVRGPNKSKEQVFEIGEKNGEPYVFLIDYDGKLIRQKQEEYHSVSLINISDDGSRIACSFYTFNSADEEISTDKTIIYNRQLEQIANLDFLVRDIIYDNDMIYAISPRHLIAYDIKLNTKQYSVKLKGKSVILSKIIVGEKESINIITRSGSTNYANLYDKQGNFQKKISLGEICSNTTINSITEKILLRSNTIVTDGKIRTMKLR